MLKPMFKHTFGCGPCCRPRVDPAPGRAWLAPERGAAGSRHWGAGVPRQRALLEPPSPFPAWRLPHGRHRAPPARPATRRACPRAPSACPGHPAPPPCMPKIPSYVPGTPCGGLAPPPRARGSHGSPKAGRAGVLREGGCRCSHGCAGVLRSCRVAHGHAGVLGGVLMGVQECSKAHMHTPRPSPRAGTVACWVSRVGCPSSCLTNWGTAGCKAVTAPRTSQSAGSFCPWSAASRQPRAPV